MDEIPILGHDKEAGIIQEVMARYGAPAFARRAKQVEEAYEQILSHCRQQRAEWLKIIGIRLAILHALVGDWPALQPWLADEQITFLKDLFAELTPTLRISVETTSSGRKVRRALRELSEGIRLFNRRRQRYLDAADLQNVNRLRENYNRYFVLEKECALRSARLARQGFQPLPPMTLEEVSRLFPPLPELQC